MKIKEFFRSLAGTKEEKRGIEEILDYLETGVASCEKESNYIYSVIALFNLIAPLYDSGDVGKIYRSLKCKSWRAKDQKLAILKDLKEVIKNTGRDLYGMNRTRKGQNVTTNNVYLGDLYGLFTHPAKTWLEKERSLKSTLRGDLRLNGIIPSEWYIINDVHAGIFFQSNINELKRIIKWYKTGENSEVRWKAPQDFARLD